MSLQTRLSDLITALGTDYKQLRTWITGSSSGDLTGLSTTDKSSLLAAINEIFASASPTPDASTTVKGKIEIATLAEVGTGTDTVRAVTPEGVRQERTAAIAAATSPPASTIIAGDIEIATLAEVATGTDTARAVTPEGVHQEIVSAATPAASTTVQGKIEIATLAEVTTGTDSVRAVTPQGVRQERDAVKAEILGAGVPAALDTLDELAAALGDDANFAASVTTSLAGKQPLDSDLTAIAALVSAADKVPYSTGAGTWALADFSAAGRALVDDADAAAQRTTLSVYSQTQMGDPETDLAALYTTAKT